MNNNSKKNVLVTLADKNFIPQAKQLFSSAYWNGGWQGDFLLLAHEIPEEDLRWFREKGILVFPCKALSEKSIAGVEHPSVVLDKFYLFTPFFKKWKRVIFLDADIIIRASLEELVHIEEPFSSPNAHGTSLRQEFIKRNKANRKLFKTLERKYPLFGRAFNSGIMAIKTGNVEADSFEKLMNLYQRFGTLNKYGEEATINLLFYRKWHRISDLFNVYPFRTHRAYRMPYEKMEGIIFHFVREVMAKPWLPASFFHDEWVRNLEKADAIDIAHPREPQDIWTIERKRRYLRSLALRKFITYYRPIFYFFDWLVGKVGLCIKKLSPTLYEKVRIKN
jgi:lipopolysaccharide biosynthesis glycosyltransferase